MAAVAACGTPESGPSGEARPLFRVAAVENGLDFRHSSGSRGAYCLPEIMAPGVALLDHYFLQGGPLGPDTAARAAAVPSGPPTGNRLYENRLAPDGRLAFFDSTHGSGLGTEAYSMGVAAGDYDGDCDPGIFLTILGPNALLRKNSDGSFESVNDPQDHRWTTTPTATWTVSSRTSWTSRSRTPRSASRLRGSGTIACQRSTTRFQAGSSGTTAACSRM